jgi:hypothetical protein
VHESVAGTEDAEELNTEERRTEEQVLRSLWGPKRLDIGDLFDRLRSVGLTDRRPQTADRRQRERGYLSICR